MNRNRWIVIIGSTLLGLIAVAVSVLSGGGWAVVVLEVGGVGTVVVLFLRPQREDEDLEPGQPVSTALPLPTVRGGELGVGFHDVTPAHQHA